MKVVAHPVVVAAALGLLGPEALEGLEESAPSEPTCVDCDEPDPERLVAALDDTWFTVEAPSPEDVARVDLAWKQIRR